MANPSKEPPQAGGTREDSPIDLPPLLKTWGGMYRVVLGALVIVVALLAWLTHVYSAGPLP